MNERLPQRDPGGAYRRRVLAKRRLDQKCQCQCGEARPEALIRGKGFVECAACERANRGLTSIDLHHFAGKANSPIAIPVLVNDHCAWLSPQQYDWPKRTLRNPLGSPLLAAAACVRGFVDTVNFLLDHGLLWTAEMLETLDELLLQEWGPRWWVKSAMNRFVPKDKK